MPHTTLSIISDDAIIGFVDTNTYNRLRVYKEQWTWKAINNWLLDKLNHHVILFSTAWEEE